jgi:4-amino-4-deoxy-L-arabinose transferase-like glycosyltransferase
VTAIITVAWAVALTVVLVLRDRLPAGDRWWLWTCVAGLGLGTYHNAKMPRIKRGRDRSAARRSREPTGKT